MKVTRFIAYTVLATSFGFSALHAKSLRDGVTPAEFPPATFKGEQYVDSKGCIYIRAGIDGNVTWVPRVSRKRQQVCGYKPSLTAAQIASAPITKPSGPAPVQITVAPTAASPSKPAPAAAAKKPRTTSAAPAPVAAAASTPVAVAAAPAKPAARATRRAPEPLVFVNPPPERVAAATVPTAPTTARTTAPRPAPVPLLFVNPPPEKVAAAQVPTATTTTRPARHTASSRPEPQPLVYVNNPPAVQTTSSAARATPASTTAAGNDTCSGASALSRQYINSNARFPVRCGPQTQSAVTAYVPSTTQRTPTPPPAARPVPAPVQSAVAAPVPTPAVAPLAPATASTTVRAQNNGSCPGASAFSQQYINSSAKYPVRCGPQAASPVTSYRGAAGTGRVQAADTTTRIVPRHVYENRQNAKNVQVAEGYQNVWKDDRLNPHRAERTAAPIVVRIPSRTPSGYKPAWDDDRLNTARAKGTAAGDAQSNQIWTQRLPRELIVPPVPADKQIVVLSSRNSTAPVARTSTRSAPKATGQVAGTPKYVRVAAYDSDASARSVAKKLAQSGLPMRLGTVTKKGKSYRVVLAGPFVSTEQANAALAKVRGAGYRSAKISK
jgi:SPOR domain